MLFLSLVFGGFGAFLVGYIAITIFRAASENWQGDLRPRSTRSKNSPFRIILGGGGKAKLEEDSDDDSFNDSKKKEDIIIH